MTHEEQIEKLLAHDYHLKSLTDSVQKMTATAAETNSSIRDLIESMHKQKLLQEKVVNMDINVKEAFERVNHKISKLEDSHKGGCPLANKHVEEVKGLAEVTKTKLNVLQEKVQKLEDNSEACETKVSKIVDPKILMWLGGLVIMYLISFGSYTVSTINDLSTKYNVITAEQTQINKSNTALLQKLFNKVNTHYQSLSNDRTMILKRLNILEASYHGNNN